MSTLFSFIDQQLSTLNAAADRIVPPDETIGAAHAGAANFIVGLLNNELAGERATYINGLAGIEQESQAGYARPFGALAPEQQDELLKAIEDDLVKTAWLISPRGFFLLLMENVLEGFYADPGNGGNRNAASWKMMGYRAEGGMW